LHRRELGIITSNDVPSEPADRRQGKDVVIGNDCWIGTPAVIPPGVELGPNISVGAGSVVIHSFPRGKFLIAGSPDHAIKSL